jgi:hypothetical protein
MATSASACSCCVTVLNQQNRETLHHQRPPLVNSASQPPTKLCTVVENGRVVVRPIDELPNQQ